MKFDPLYGSAKLEKRIINEEGSVGVVTLWSKWREMVNETRNVYPSLLESTSPIVLYSTLYGNGLSMMLANLSYNPQINKLAIVGKDSKVIPSSTYLENFFEKGVEKEFVSGTELSRIKGTQFYVDPNLDPDSFSYMDIMRFKSPMGQDFYEFVTTPNTRALPERRRITLTEPHFNSFPSDITTHSLIGKTPIDAWIEILHKIHRFGKTVNLKKGSHMERRRLLLDVNVSVTDPLFEETRLLNFGFDPQKIRAYQNEILNGAVPLGTEYTYGNRLRSYWGGDCLGKVITLLKDNPDHSFAFTTLWDPKADLLDRKSAPCFTDIHFMRNPDTEKLMVMAGYRAQDALSAWLPNVYGLMALQEEVSEKTGIPPGRINLRTRYLSLNPLDSSAAPLITKALDSRRVKPQIFDPRGNYLVEADSENHQIKLSHYDLNGILLEEIVGEDMFAIKDRLRALDALNSPDHAVWIGMELARAQNELNQDDKSG